MSVYELVVRLKLENRVKGEQVFCPGCNLSIADGEQKVVASNFVRHANCHMKWRKIQGYQGRRWSSLPIV